MYFNEDVELKREDLEKIHSEKLAQLREIENHYGKNSDYIRLLSDIGLIEIELEKYTEAEERFNTCLNHFLNQQDRFGQAATLGILGALYFKMKRYDDVISKYRAAFQIYDKLKQVSEKITCLHGIGNALIKLNKLDEACDIFLECSSLCSDNNDIYSLLDCLGNLVEIHEKLQRWDVLYELYLKSLAAFKEIKDNQGIIITYFNLGILLKRQNRFEEALTYFKQGTNVAIDANYAELILKGLGYVGELFVYLNDFKRAKHQYIKALSLAKKVKATNAILQINVLLRSLGLSNDQIEDELVKYDQDRKEKSNSRIL